MTTPYKQQGGLSGSDIHVNVPDVLNEGFCFDANEDGDVLGAVRIGDAKRPVLCSRCGALAVQCDHLHPYDSTKTLCLRHCEEKT